MTRVVAHVVDPSAVAKVKAQVYRGFSLGGSVVERDPSDPRTITKLLLNELSLVDRPADPSAKVELWKRGAQPVPFWDCGDSKHAHSEKVAAAWCRAKRTMAQQRGAKVKSKKQAKKPKKMQKALNKKAGIPNDPIKQAAEILSRPIVPDSNDIQKRQQGLTSQRPN